MRPTNSILYLGLVIFFFSCLEEPAPLFVDRLEDSGINFRNDLSYTEDYNPYTYRNFFNGGGVAVGDINNDGWVDIYLTGNLVDNKLYINNGDWTFRDVTLEAGVGCKGVWSSGAVMVDINGDNLLDIYVCKAGKPGGDNRHNELFINQGDLKFKEESKVYGLDITGLSVQSSFFDYDRDGDLDCYLLNNSLRSVGGFDLNPGLRDIPDSTGNKFFENQNGKFVDVTTGVGIYSSSVGFGLGVAVSDFNRDGWPDMYIANDFFEKDYLYINNKNDSFSEVGEEWMSAMSMGSMGCDAADVNNDGWIDLFVAEMLPASLERQKTKAVYDSWDKQQTAIKAEYGKQYPRNAFHLNTNGNKFHEVSRMAGVHATEWSWSSMFCDLDNDGWRDIFVCNGIGKDLLDRDYLSYVANSAIQSKLARKDITIDSLVHVMPSERVSNFVFRNEHNLQFTDVTQEWGLDNPSFSNGGSYADLDNDGDLDLVINNVNDPVGIFENTTDTSLHRSLSLAFRTEGMNTRSIGARMELKWNDGTIKTAEQYVTRGFQSSVSDIVHIGIGHYRQVDTLIVHWPTGETSIYSNLKSNQIHTLQTSFEESVERSEVASSENLFMYGSLPFEHNENISNEFNRERLLTQMNSNQGPAIAIADVDNDGRNEYFIGGAKGQESVLLRKMGVNNYQHIPGPWEIHSSSEVVKVVFFDSDADGDQDLYVGHGDRVFSIYSPELDDVLYINDGKGNFVESKKAINFERPFATGAIAISDYNQDGLPDLFLGERYKNDFYGLEGSGYLYKNMGDNRFELDEEKSIQLADLGMVTDAVWVDLDQDNTKELVICGEWMAITIIRFHSGKMTVEELSESVGVWQDMHVADIDTDGDYDLILGNVGQNTHFQPDMRMYVGDFDKNGSIEQVLSYKINGVDYPIHDMDEIVSQLPGLKRDFVLYKDYAKRSIQDIFDEQSLKDALVLQLDEINSVILMNNGGQLKKVDLPWQLQTSSIYAIDAADHNKDGNIDLVVGGNQYLVKPQYGRQDASEGWYIRGPVNETSHVTSLDLKGEIRSILKEKEHLIFGISGDTIRTLSIDETE